MPTRHEETLTSESYAPCGSGMISENPEWKLSGLIGVLYSQNCSLVLNRNSAVAQHFFYIQFSPWALKWGCALSVYASDLQ